MEKEREEKGEVEQKSEIEQFVAELTEHWNALVDDLIDAREHWESMQKMLLSSPRDALDEAPMEVQKVTKKFRRAKFVVMLERFVEYFRAYGGLEKMKVKKEGGR